MLVCLLRIDPNSIARCCNSSTTLPLYSNIKPLRRLLPNSPWRYSSKTGQMSLTISEVNVQKKEHHKQWKLVLERKFLQICKHDYNPRNQNETDNHKGLIQQSGSERDHALQTYSAQWEKRDESFKSAVKENATVSGETRMSFKTVSTTSTASDSVTWKTPTQQNKKRCIKLKVVIEECLPMTCLTSPKSSEKDIRIDVHSVSLWWKMLHPPSWFRYEIPTMFCYLCHVPLGRQLFHPCLRSLLCICVEHSVQIGRDKAESSNLQSMVLHLPPRSDYLPTFHHTHQCTTL